MPHFIIECSADIFTSKEQILDIVYGVAESSGLFAEDDIKVRIKGYEDFKMGKTKQNFLHVFGHIMEGRSLEQRALLTKQIVTALNHALPDISILSMNIQEFERATYCNKALIHRENHSNDRHFKKP